jgi:hypothetical protein
MWGIAESTDAGTGVSGTSGAWSWRRWARRCWRGASAADGAETPLAGAAPLGAGGVLSMFSQMTATSVTSPMAGASTHRLTSGLWLPREIPASIRAIIAEARS